jgi:hypothetical protein
MASGGVWKLVDLRYRYFGAVRDVGNRQPWKDRNLRRWGMGGWGDVRMDGGRSCKNEVWGEWE